LKEKILRIAIKFEGSTAQTISGFPSIFHRQFKTIGGLVYMRICDEIYFLCGLNGGNVGIVKGEGEVALIDAGWTEESVEMILSHLSLITDPEELEYVLVTHADRDHVGGLSRLQNEFDVKIVVNKGDADKISKPMPPVTPSRPDVVFEERQKLVVGGVELELIPTPGHTPGSSCVYYHDHDLLFTGDVVMPPFYHARYNRRIQVPIVRGDFDVYVDSLRRLAKLEVDWLLPGHGMPIRDGNKRINEYVTITSTLLEKALSLLKDELTPSELAEKLNAFPTMGPRIVSELEKDGKIARTRMKTILQEPLYCKR
jgi:glyoxylase-like metal-dependent hydrolase (beta-lactamase superfamily II)